MPLEMHIGGPASAPLARQVAFIRRAEELGFAGVGIADHVEYGHDVYVTLALAAADTSTIQLYPAITNPVTRHPFVLASLASSLAALAPGRIKLAIGPGDTGVIQAGLKPATLDELRRAVEAIRRLLRGQTDDGTWKLFTGDLPAFAASDSMSFELVSVFFTTNATARLATGVLRLDDITGPQMVD